MATSRFTNHHRPRGGWSLIELIAVLAVMIALAALVVPRLGNLQIGTPTGPKSPEHIATEATMSTIRDVIMGTAGSQGAWADLVQRPGEFPRRISDLFEAIAPTYVSVPAFDPVTKIGWRGPYFGPPTGSYTVDASRGFVFEYGADNPAQADGARSLVDGWGNSIVIQFPDLNGDGLYQQAEYESEFVRLVSAGENGVIETDRTAAAPLVFGDDVVMFLRVSLGG